MKSQLQFRVRYSETDQMGYVHHSNYIKYFEMGRIEWLRTIGMDYAQMEKDGILLPVVNIQVKYIQPAYYDEVLTLETSLNSKISAKMAFENKLFNSKGELITTAVVHLVFLDGTTRKPRRPPKDFIAALTAHR